MTQQTKTENGLSYINHKSVPVDFTVLVGDGLVDVGKFLIECGVRCGDQIYVGDTSMFLLIPDSYRDIDEEDVPIGAYYVVFPDKKVLIYTPAEFEANFKMV